MPRLRRVLYLSNMDASMKFGSWEEQVFFLARAFHRQGGVLLPAFVSLPNPEDMALYKAEGCAVICLNLKRFSFSTFLDLIHTIRRRQIEIVHWNYYHPLSVYFWVMLLLAPRLQHYLTDHNSLPIEVPPTWNGIGRRVIHIIKRIVLKRYAKVFGVSQFVVEQMDKTGIWSSQPHRWTHRVNTERFKPDTEIRHAVRQKIGVDGRFVMVTIAHLIPEKGIDLVLRALLHLPAPVIFWIVGSGAAAESLQSLCHELSLKDRVRFFGLQREVQPYLQAADCFVCPSIWQEAAGLVILEAMACGLPVIASQTGGIPEFVEDGKTGLLFPSKNISALAAQISRLHNDPFLCQAMSKAARDATVGQFSLQRGIDEYLAFYRVNPA